MSSIKSHNEQIVTDGAHDWGDLPYSQGIVAGDLVFVSGQLGVDRATGRPADGIEPQTRSVLEQIAAILAAAGCTMADVVKTSCYLTDRERDYVGFNKVYRQFFTGTKPARVTVEVSKLAPGFIVEIDAIARRPAAAADTDAGRSC